MVTRAQFAGSWESFLRATEAVVEASGLGTELVGAAPPEDGDVGLVVDRVFSELRDDVAVEAVAANAAYEYDLAGGGERERTHPVALVEAELRAFAGAVEADGEMDAELAGRRAGQAKTIKDSLEEHVSLPGPLSRLLDLLNELLSLVRG